LIPSPSDRRQIGPDIIDSFPAASMAVTAYVRQGPVPVPSMNLIQNVGPRQQKQGHQIGKREKEQEPR
jgi:hypothetical protein